MRKWTAAVLLLCPLMLCGCGDEKEDTWALVTSCDTPFYDQIAEGFTQEANRLGRQAVIETPEEMSIAEQYEILQKLQREEIKGLVIVPNSATAFNEIVTEYVEAQIPVIAVESALNTEDVFLEVLACDCTQVAEELLARTAEFLGGEGMIAILSTTNQTPMTETIIKEIRALLESGVYPDILLTEVAYGNNEEERYSTKMEHLCETYENLDMVLALSSQATKGAAAYITEEGLENSLYVTGFGLEEEMEEYLGGAVPFYYTFDPGRLGRVAALALEKAVQKEEPYKAGDQIEMEEFGVFEVFAYTGVYSVEDQRVGYPAIRTEETIQWIESEDITVSP